MYYYRADQRAEMTSDVEVLRERWNELYRGQLPTLAKEKNPVQSRWPVYLDHCFARIVLDNAIGRDCPWTEVVKQPAIKHMTEQELKAAIGLAERIATGEANLEDLNNTSLALRGKKKRKIKDEDSPQQPGNKKQRRVDGNVSSYFLPSPQLASKPANVPRTNPSQADAQTDERKESTSGKDRIDMDVQIQRVQDSNLTSFRKKALTLLCQIPRGRYSTYQALSDYITRSSHKTCARAVGNAMRNNPFAPEVPCHRVLANDGSLGGFGGSWGENGKFAGKKHQLLHEEGVRFDSRGKVKGPPFRDFTA